MNALAAILIDSKLAARQKEPIETYKPYEKTQQFHDAGAGVPQRCLIAANQIGKTMAAAAEVSFHLTGLYPDWWSGLRFDKPVKVWVSGLSPTQLQDAAQEKLLCRHYSHYDAEVSEDSYAGMIPSRLIVSKRVMQGSPENFAYVKVIHVSGGVSDLAFKPYSIGRENLQGAILDLIWLDEEPKKHALGIYYEMLKRTTHGQKGNRSIVTYTPLLGMTDLTKTFIETPNKDQSVTNIGLKHVPDWIMSAEVKKQQIDNCETYMRKARIEGLPELGTGAVFSVDIEKLKQTWIPLSQIPTHWRYIAGLDFGINDDQALAACFWDAEAGIFYVWRSLKEPNQLPGQFAATIRVQEPKLLDKFKIAWPHDGLQREKGTGIQLYQYYKKHGFRMLPHFSKSDTYGLRKMPSVIEIHEAMRQGQFVLLGNHPDLEQELRLYHWKANGQLSDGNDHIIDAVRQAWVMRGRGALGDPAEPTEIERFVGAHSRVNPYSTPDSWMSI